MNAKALLLAASLVAASIPGISMAAEVSTEPVGFNKVTALGNSDTRFSLPLHRPTVFAGAVLSVNNSVLTIQGGQTLSANQLVYSAGVQSNVYYVTFTTGTRAGMYYTVVANNGSTVADASTITVDLNGDTLQGAGGVVAGDKFQVVPYWSLNTVFPGQVGITKTAQINGVGALTRILFFDPNFAGVNPAASAIYYYFEGTTFGGSGWRKVGGGFTAIKNDDIILPDMYVVIRQEEVSTSLINTAVGLVPSGERKYIVGTLLPNADQDNVLAIDIPVPMSLAQSNLYQSGAFVGTSQITGSTGDKLLLFDDSLVLKNKAASKIYYYFTGDTFGGPGWRMLGGGFTSVKNNDVVFQPGSGFIIRKQATPTPTTTVWTIPAVY
ncbi:TIGR02597 family protein [Verrucomicrobium sp. BvORR034]|uniref:TIGR02597 family protein n=1 Tax=Verrucomicrobium sp. BvORR034 TaxID=1396418 RepID=UPI00067985CA|nr:TIGR02597 family protein [Verrucomicrobium sp. BvORR034]